MWIFIVIIILILVGSGFYSKYLDKKYAVTPVTTDTTVTTPTPIVGETVILHPISFLPFPKTVYRSLVEEKLMEELPESFNHFMDNKDLVSRNKYVLLVPCFHRTCQPESFYLFVRLTLPNIKQLLRIGNRGKIMVEYTIESKLMKIDIPLEDIDKLVKLGPISAGSNVRIQAKYKLENIEEVRPSDILNISVPVMDSIYCSTIPYNQNQYTLSYNNTCYPPTDETMMFNCLTRSDPSDGFMLMWDKENKECAPLKKQKPPVFIDICEEQMKKSNLNEYCDGQETELPRSINYKCEFPKAGNAVYDKDTFVRAFESEVDGKNVEDYWIEKGTINSLDDAWNKVYQCDKRYDGKTIDKISCLSFADDRRKAVCNNYRLQKQLGQNCAEWVDEYGVAKCAKCKKDFYGDLCNYDLAEAREQIPGCDIWEYNNDQFICTSCKDDFYGDNCRFDLKPHKKKYPNCDEWEFQDDNFNCVSCKDNFYGDTCEYDIRPSQEEAPNCEEWKFTGAGDSFDCVKCKKDHYGPSCKINLAAIKKANPNCIKWDIIDDKIQCLECRYNYYGEDVYCKHNVVPFKLENPRCETWDYEEDTFECKECKPPYFGLDNKCQNNRKTVETDNPGCAKWELINDEYKCMECLPNFYNTNENCKYSLDKISEDNPGCNDWEFTGDGFRCVDCKPGFYGERENCKYDVAPLEKQFPGCNEWDYVGTGLRCLNCKDGYHVSDENCKYSVKEVGEKYPNCSDWLFDDINKKFVCDKCGTFFSGENCEVDLTKEYPHCKNWVSASTLHPSDAEERTGDGRFICAACQDDYYSLKENCERHISETEGKSDHCQEWMFDEEDGEFVCKTCDNYYSGKLCETDLSVKYPHCQEWSSSQPEPDIIESFEGEGTPQFKCSACEPGYGGENCTVYLMKDKTNCLNKKWDRKEDGSLVCKECKPGSSGDYCDYCECDKFPSGMLCNPCKNCDIAWKGGPMPTYTVDGKRVTDVDFARDCQKEDPPWSSRRCRESTSDKFKCVNKYPGCAELVKEEGQYVCKKCNPGYFGEAKFCKYNLDQIKNAHPNCEGEWIYDETKGKIVCQKCRDGFVGDYCTICDCGTMTGKPDCITRCKNCQFRSTDPKLDANWIKRISDHCRGYDWAMGNCPALLKNSVCEEKSEGCARFMETDDGLVCEICKTGFYGDNCQYNRMNAQEQTPGCIVWKFTGDGFICQKCGGDYYGDKCEYDINRAEYSNPNCSEFEFMGDDFNCTSCNNYMYKNVCSRSVDIGTSPVPGFFKLDENGIYTIKSSGIDVWAHNDSFHFVYTPYSGDVVMTARIISIERGGNNPTKFGFMIRESLGTNAKHYYLDMWGVGNFIPHWRLTTGGSTSHIPNSPVKSFPYWIKLKREGNTFISLGSSNGYDWTEFHKMEIPEFKKECYIGMALTSGGSYRTLTGKLDNLVIADPRYEYCDEVVDNKCVSCRPDYYGEDEYCKYNLLPLKDKHENCAEWEFVDGEFNCIGCNENYYGEEEYCKYDIMPSIEKHLGCDEWEFTGSGFKCMKCKEDYSVINQNCDINVSEVKGNDPGCAKWEFTDDSYGCLECHKYMYKNRCSNNADLGTVPVPGSFDVTDGVYTIKSSGKDIWGSSDSCHFAHTPYVGDVAIFARITELEKGGGDHTKFGLMIRESADANAAFYFTNIWPNGLIAPHWRLTTEGHAAHSSNNPTTTIPYWLKLVREGDTFTSYASENGYHWNEIHSMDIPGFSKNTKVGIALSSADANKLVTGKLDNLVIIHPKYQNCDQIENDKCTSCRFNYYGEDEYCKYHASSLREEYPGCESWKFIGPSEENGEFECEKCKPDYYVADENCIYNPQKDKDSYPRCVGDWVFDETRKEFVCDECEAGFEGDKCDQCNCDAVDPKKCHLDCDNCKMISLTPQYVIERIMDKCVEKNWHTGYCTPIHPAKSLRDYFKCVSK